MLLSFTGAALGVLFAYRALAIIIHLLPKYSFPHEADIQINLPVLGFSVAIAMVKNAKKLEPKVYRVPDDLDKRVAKLKLESMSIKIDKLTPEQEEYLAGWNEGT